MSNSRKAPLTDAHLRDRTKNALLPLAVILSFSAEVHAEVLWRGDFETGTTEQWGGNPKAGEFKVVQEPVRAGKYALRIDGSNVARRGANDRIEFQHQPKPPGTAETTTMHILWMLIIGLIVGALAKFIMPGRDPGGIIVTILLGIAGSFVAGFLGRSLGWYRDVNDGPGIIASVIGAVILLAIYRAVVGRTHHTTRPLAP